MKYFKIIIYLSSFLLLTNCTDTLDKPLNKEDIEKVKGIINQNESFSNMKKKFLIDNLNMQLGFAEFGKSVKGEGIELPTFRKQISKLSSEYDSILTVKNQAVINNQQLENLVELLDASTLANDKYNGFLKMKIKFNNSFDKEILYIILNYNYINKYDSEFFNEKAKLTDEVAGDFKGEKEITIPEKYNKVSEFIYTKVPVRARKELREQLGEKEADRKVERDFLMEGLKLKTLLIVFKDKSELKFEDANWKYLE